MTNKEAIELMLELMDGFDKDDPEMDKYEEALCKAINVLTDNDMQMHVMKGYQERLMEMMPEREFNELVTRLAKEGFRLTIENMTNEDLKDFCEEHFDEITEGAIGWQI